MGAIERERRGHVEILRINRPEARNAVDGHVTQGFEAALDRLEEDRDVWAIVVTGTGDVFCAGADLKKIAAGEMNDLFTRRGGFGGFTSRDIGKPLIAAVNGSALAGGFEIVLTCDLVVAAENAEFGLPEVTRGLFAAAGGLVRLPKMLPRAAAMEIGMVGHRISAARAHELGIVNRVVPRERVLDEALALADAVCANPPTATRAARHMLREAVDLTEVDAWTRSGELAVDVFASEDSIEGARAFAEKRPPRWTNP
ncbi:MAG: crotonase/enoyl-CoA hydratase family protein [Acidimicrobiia bacterium]